MLEPTPPPERRPSKPKQSPPAPATELEALIGIDAPPEFLRAVDGVLRSGLFKQREGLTSTAVGALSYRRARALVRSAPIEAHQLRRDLRKLYALHESLIPVDAVAGTVLSIHYCLAMGSIIMHGQSRPELEPFLRELERMDSVGVFLATELGYGNNVASLETRAEYDPETREFVLDSPSPKSLKFMPNTACPFPKLAVVMARLICAGRNHGIFPFLVRLRDRDGGLCPGVQIEPLSEKPGYALDNAVTRFVRMRIPKAHLLSGADCVLHDDGRFESRITSRLERFLRAMDRVQTGRVCFTSGAVACLRAAAWIATRYTDQRLTFAPGRRSTTLLSYRNVQADVFGATAAAYALTLAVRALQRRFQRSSAGDEECFRWVATLKAVGTEQVAHWLLRLRERCGAAGLFSANRIVDYTNQVQGIITAEGDNQLILLKVGKQLCEQNVPSPTVVPRWHTSKLPPSAAFLQFFRFRVARLRSERQAAMTASCRTCSPFDAWNGNVNGLMELASAHGEALIAECFQAALRTDLSLGTRRQLEWLHALWCLERIQVHAGWYLAEGVLAPSVVKQLTELRVRVCAELEPHISSLVDAFGLDNSLLQAPIAEPDYVVAYAAPFEARDQTTRTSESSANIQTRT